MKRLIYIPFLIALAGCSQSQNNSSNKTTMKEQLTNEQLPKTEAEWKEMLTPEQYGILRMKGTERPGTGEFLYHKEKGIYSCGGCGADLFSSDMKFESHCGWPSFDRELEGGKIKQIADFSHGMIRTEIVCARCGGHLGHIFDDGPTETGMRYCVNSLSLGFKKTE
jgi:methionine-R-sulfoxide reductase